MDVIGTYDAFAILSFFTAWFIISCAFVDIYPQSSAYILLNTGFFTLLKI
jgi:hypothetical protein